MISTLFAFIIGIIFGMLATVIIIITNYENRDEFKNEEIKERNHTNGEE